MSIIKKIENTDRIAEGYVNDFRKIIDRIEARLSQTVKAGVWTNAEVDAALVREQLNQIMVDSGYQANINKMFDKGYQDLLAQNVEFYNQRLSASLRYTPESLDKLNLIKQLDLEKFESLGESQVRELERVIINAQFGSISSGDLTAQLKSTLDEGMSRYADTWVNTAISGFDRVAGSTIALDGGVEYFEYIGPDDKLTRPFCEEHLGQVKKWEEWDAMVNDQGSKVTVYCGGARCRHQLVAVPNPE